MLQLSHAPRGAAVKAPSWTCIPEAEAGLELVASQRCLARMGQRWHQTPGLPMRNPFEQQPTASPEHLSYLQQLNFSYPGEKGIQTEYSVLAWKACGLCRESEQDYYPQKASIPGYMPALFSNNFLSKGFLSVGCEERGLREITCEGFIHAYEPSSLVHWKTDYANNGQIILTLSPKMPRRPALYLQ